MAERGGSPTGLAVTMARLRAKWGIEQGEDTVPERWKCYRCGHFVDEPPGDECHDTLGWHGRKVIYADGFTLDKPGVNPNCPTCHGLGWLRKPTDSGNEAIACPDCFGPALRSEATARMWEGIPRGLRNLTLASYSLVGGDPNALEWVQGWLSRNDPDIPWLVLFGPRGTGKTGLAVGVCHALSIERGLRQVVFATVVDLMTRLRATNRPDSGESEAALLQSVKDAEVLVLDDLGSSRRTDYAEEKLFEIVDYRYTANLVTIFTTNEDPNDLADVGGQLDRLVSRMVQRACFVEVREPDLRQQVADRRRQ